MKIRYKVVFLERINNILHVACVKNLKNSLNDIIKVRDRDYHIDFSNVAYSNQKTFVYFIDIKNGSQFTFNEVKNSINPKTLDLIVSQKIIKELSQSISENPISKFMLIMLIVAGLLGGFILGSLYTESKYAEPPDNPYTNMLMIRGILLCLMR